METKDIKKIVIAAGGTGGHIYPGIAIACAIESICPQSEIAFISGSRPIESEIYNSEGRCAFALPVFPTGKGIKGKIVALKNFFSASNIAYQKLNEIKPNIVLGMGGYVSAPVLKAAKKHRIPFFIHEQNSIPGKVNRYFCKSASKCFCSFKKSIQYFGEQKSILTGYPIRKRFLKIPPKEEAIKYFNFSREKKTILIQGGSQGAKFLNLKLLKSLIELDKNLTGKSENIQLIWSSGKLNYEEVASEIAKYEFKKISILIKPFISEMEMALSVSDLIISRAGAGSISEILAAGKPSILIPLPTAADDHQRFNADEVKEDGGAEVIEENLINTPTFINLISSLLSDSEKLLKMSEAARRIAKSDAADKIAKFILEYNAV